MKQVVLSQFDIPWIPITGLLIFVVCFAAYTYWTFRKANKAFYDKAAEIPLQEAPKFQDLSKGN
jgi:cbb3-type cytochrome oxidase subunit 3